VGGDSNEGLLKMYRFCTAKMPIRAILAISEYVISAKGESLQLLIFPVLVPNDGGFAQRGWMRRDCSSPN
jgi:hypothetical protein